MAGHLRLFREARATLQSRQQNNVDLVQVFFDKEAERERDICRDAICLKEESEKGWYYVANKLFQMITGTNSFYLTIVMLKLCLIFFFYLLLL